MIASMERFFKQAIVDKNPTVSSAALVSACHLFNNNKEVVKRWVNEVQEASQSKCNALFIFSLVPWIKFPCHDSDNGAVPRPRPHVPNPSKGPYGCCQARSGSFLNGKAAVKTLTALFLLSPELQQGRCPFSVRSLHAHPLCRQGHGGRGGAQPGEVSV